MIQGELRSRIDRVWDAFWSGGISNPLEVIEQITYLLFLRRLDDLQDNAERKARFTGSPIENPVYLPGQEHLRWKNLRELSPDQMFARMSGEVFPYLQNLGHQFSSGGDSTFTQHMKGARFTIPNAQLLTKVVDMLDQVPMENRDTNGDLYEYMLSKLATSGTNGQFRTPRHIIELMVDLMAPKPGDRIVDPACGTAGFLVAASEYLREHYEELFRNASQRKAFHTSMFSGFDFDSTMLRIGSMNMLMHGVENPEIAYRDSLSEGAAGEESRYTLVLANPPFAGSLDYDTTSSDLLRMVKTKKTELLFLALFLRLLEPGGRAAVIVPDGILFGSSKAHKDLRKAIVEDQKLDAVIKLPSGVFRPYAGVSTAIFLFTKTDSGGTEDVWFYDVRADGFSLDDKRTPIDENDLPDVRKRWAERHGSERDRARTEQSFCVPKAEIVEQGYDLSLNRYKEIEYEEVEHRDPADIIADIKQLNAEIDRELAELEEMLR